MLSDENPAPTPVTARDALAKAIDAGIRDWEDGGGPLQAILDRRVSGAVQTPAEFAATLADDEALTERVSRLWWERDHGDAAPEWDADWQTEVKQVLRALAAALTEREAQR